MQAPRLEELQSVSDKYNEDPYTLSSRVRKRFRTEKKELKKQKDADDAVKAKYGLHDDITLLPDELDDKKREEFANAKRSFHAEEDAKRRKLEVQISQPRPLRASEKKGPTLPSSSRNSTASTILRSKLLESKSRKADPFLQIFSASTPRVKPPDIKLKAKK